MKDGKEVVAIISNFQEFNPGYSLTGIVLDQAKMLSDFGHDIRLLVCDNYHGETFSDDVTLQKVIPHSDLIDYTTRNDLTEEHDKCATDVSDVLAKYLEDVDICLTHDFVFTGWNLPYSIGIRRANDRLPDIKWLHWVHSVPNVGNRRDWWNIREYGPNHKLVCPTRYEVIRWAEAFGGQPSDVRTIPHIKDIRTWFDFDPESFEFLQQFPELLHADAVQVYPASTDRLEQKRVRELSLIFSKIKKQELSVCLVVANQWATGRQRKEDVEKYYKIASRNGLKRDEEFIFTSEWKEKYATGLPKRILRDLMLCANIFIFPTRDESFGLVGPEAALCGAYMVHNKSMGIQHEIHGHTGLYFDFGSYHQVHHIPKDNEENYYNDIAKIIIGRMRRNEGQMNRTFIRQNYNYDTIYHKHYAPIMAEARKTWPRVAARPRLVK